MTGTGEMGLHWCEDLSAHCSFDSRGKYTQTESDKGIVYNALLTQYYLCMCWEWLKSSCLSISRFKLCPGRAISQSDQLFIQEWVCGSTVLTPRRGEQKLGAGASAQRHELGQAGPFFPPRGWPVPAALAAPGSLSAMQTQVLPQYYRTRTCLSKSLCDWPAHLSLRNNESDFCEILLLKYTIRINTVLLTEE